jgi:glucosylceramidase
MKKIILIFAGIMALSGMQAQSGKKSNPEKRKISVVVTAKGTNLRMSKATQLQFAPTPQPFEHIPCIFVDSNRTFQTFLGIGAALTDASAETFAKLPASKQDEFLKMYFNKEKGIGYTIARTNMNSCDFSSGSYTYVDESDVALTSFSIAHDEQYKIPLIKKAMEAANGDIKLYISPWSPPAWMKKNKNMLQGGSLESQYYQTWANYFVKFIKAYEAQDIPVWGLTVQNEPMAKQTWESCIYTAEEERDFIKKYLGPTLWENGLKEKKLMAWDHNRDLLYHRAATILEDPEAAKYLWGIGFHWYEPGQSGAALYGNVKLVSEAFPEMQLMLTEACNYPFSWDTFEEWHWGENYGTAMINDFNNGAVAWTDWNILLDETGGPNHVKNFCFAPVHADTRDGSLHYMNSFFYIGHFSKFIQPGAKRIACSSSRSQLLSTAFKNPDGTCAVIVMNTGDTEMTFKLYVEGYAAEASSLPHSILTLVF